MLKLCHNKCTDMGSPQYESTYVSEEVQKAFSHWVHLCFSKVWVLICLSSLLLCKVFSKWLQWYDFSSVWVIMCWCRTPLLMKAFSQWLHLVFPLCETSYAVTYNPSMQSIFHIGCIDILFPSMSVHMLVKSILKC